MSSIVDIEARKQGLIQFVHRDGYRNSSKRIGWGVVGAAVAVVAAATLLVVGRDGGSNGVLKADR